jgi:2',3'-cyclic-nucleotide 2'-phosphodiesterase (5'-nucleotidase family)
VFALYPEEQTVLSVRLSGADLREYLEWSARYFYADSTGLIAVNRYVPAANYDLVGGASYTIDLSVPPGSRVTRLEVAGVPVQPTDSFTFALGSDRQEGRGNFPAVATAPVVRRTEMLLRDLLMQEVARRGLLRARDFEGRDWMLAPPELARKARAIFVLPAPSPPPAPAATPSAAELQTRDSLERAQLRADSIDRAPIASLRLPAEPGRGGTLARLLADAYRNELAVDVAIVPLDGGWGALAAGSVSTGMIRAAVVAEPGLVVITVPGTVLRAMAEALVADSMGCCDLSGAEIRFAPRGRPSGRLRGLSLAAGGELDERRRYSVALSGQLVGADSSVRLRGGACDQGHSCGGSWRLADFAARRVPRPPVELVSAYLARHRRPVTPPDHPRIIPVP